MSRVLVISRKFPPSVGGTQTVLKNLFYHIDPGSYRVLHDREESPEKADFDYEGQTVDWPRWLKQSLGKIVIPLYVLLIPVILWICWRMHRRERFDKCLIVYPDPFFSVAGFMFASMAGLPYVVYFHDLFEEAQRKRSRVVQWSLAKAFEEPMIRNSDKFLVISDGLKTFYEAKYGVAPTTLPHSINLSKFPALQQDERLNSESASANSDGERPFQIVYSGGIYDDQYDAIWSFVQALRSSSHDIKLTITSKQPVSYFKDVGLLTEQTEVRFLQTRDEVFDLQRDADILYLPLAFDSRTPLEVKTALPTKVFEYIASMRPIFVHCPPDSYLREYCETNRIGHLCLSRESDQIIETLTEILSAEGSVDPAYRKALLEKHDSAILSEQLQTMLKVSSDPTAGVGR